MSTDINLDDLTPEQRAAVRQAAQDAGLPAFLARMEADKRVRDAAEILQQKTAALIAARAACEPKAEQITKAHEAKLAEMRDSQRQAVAFALAPLRVAEQAHADAVLAVSDAERALAEAQAADKSAKH